MKIDDSTLIRFINNDLSRSEKKDREKIISEAKKYTVPLECWGKN